MAIRLGTAALSRQVFAGRPNKARDGFKGERHDVTSDVLKVVAEHIGMDREATVSCDGKPSYIIRIESIATREASVAVTLDALKQYIADYEMCGDVDYRPSDQERALIEDAMHGWEYDRAQLIADARAASVDTRPKGGDGTEIAAPFTSGAVGAAETPDPGSHHPKGTDQ